MVLVVLVAAVASGALRQWLKGQRTLGETAMKALRTVVVLSIWIAALFYLLWGLHYYREPAHERLGWARLDPAEWEQDPADLTTLATFLTQAVNRSYVEVHGSVDAGQPTDPPSLSRVHIALEEGYTSAQEALSLAEPLAQPHGHAKPLFSSPLFSRLGIAGIYFPFTGEANFNKDIPGWSIPHVVAHEKAHQRGIASEDEANFFGFLSCLYAPLPEARYSGLLFAQRQVVSALLKVAPEEAIRIAKQRHPGVQRDINAHRAFWLGYRGPLTDVGSAFNDTYLKLNGVKHGTDSYHESLILIALLFREIETRNALPDYLSSESVTGQLTSSPTSNGSSPSS